MCYLVIRKPAAMTAAAALAVSSQLRALSGTVHAQLPCQPWIQKAQLPAPPTKHPRASKSSVQATCLSVCIKKVGLKQTLPHTGAIT